MEGNTPVAARTRTRARLAASEHTTATATATVKPRVKSKAKKSDGEVPGSAGPHAGEGDEVEPSVPGRRSGRNSRSTKTPAHVSACTVN
jgi:hypothetical protein